MPHLLLRPVVAVSSGLDNLDYEDLELFAEVHRLTTKVIELAGSPVPAVGSPAWWSAPDTAKTASLLVLAESRLLDDPHQLAAEQLRDVSIAVSGGMNWRDFADRHIAHTELQRRRSELGPAGIPDIRSGGRAPLGGNRRQCGGRGMSVHEPWRHREVAS